uniref:Uncharacterized protein n=1 Tax=Peronospora matthiolae TaxID=2874970 RepID=A0AAV1TXP3_9STRA
MEVYRSDPVQDTYQEHQPLSHWVVSNQSLIATLIMNLVAYCHDMRDGTRDGLSGSA